jgi:N-methylhydantoinase A/oxoprolinase/acetone carboxylase beta subunit
MRVAVDVGGTFTDVVFWDAVVRTTKVTTDHQSDGLVSGIEEVGASGVDRRTAPPPPPTRCCNAAAPALPW